MKHTLIALVQDRPGVLNRVASMFRRRGFNLESLSVGPSETPDVSRLTLVVDNTDTDVEQVSKQLYRLIDVLKVSDVTADPIVARELVLVKIYAPAARRPEITSLADACGATVADVGQDALVLELAAPPDEVDNFIALARPFGIREMVRSGRVAMLRGPATHNSERFLNP